VQAVFVRAKRSFFLIEKKSATGGQKLSRGANRVFRRQGAKGRPSKSRENAAGAAEQHSPRWRDINKIPQL
jgi:hypothetical protein